MSAFDRIYPVVEIFGPTIQGEGPLIGQLTHFIRFGGCGYRCSWCDSMHAVDPEQINLHARKMIPQEIINEVLTLGGASNSARYVTLSGGDPVMWDLDRLVIKLRDHHFKTSVETQGQFWAGWLTECDSIVVSPKPPSSGMADKIKMTVLNRYVLELHNSRVPRLAFKVVVFNEEDFNWAIELQKNFPGVPFFLSVGTPRPTRMHDGEERPIEDFDTVQDQVDVSQKVLARYDDIIRMAIEKRVSGDLRILPQTHVLLWGHKQGV